MNTVHVDGWRIEDVRRGEWRSPFGGGSLGYTRATLTHDTGAVMNVSRLDDDGPDDWGVDSAFGANGMPHWCHGEAERTTAVRCLDVGPVTAALNRAARMIPEVTA